MKKIFEILEIVIILLVIFLLIFGIIDEAKKIKSLSSTINYIEQQNEPKVLKIELF